MFAGPVVRPEWNLGSGHDSGDGFLRGPPAPSSCLAAAARWPADASGIRQSEISRIESGNGNPTLKTLGALARALGAELRIASP